MMGPIDTVTNRLLLRTVYALVGASTVPEKLTASSVGAVSTFYACVPEVSLEDFNAGMWLGAKLRECGVLE